MVELVANLACLFIFEPHPIEGQVRRFTVTLPFDVDQRLGTEPAAKFQPLTDRSEQIAAERRVEATAGLTRIESGLAARAPYFSNGLARDLRGIVDYYERRYSIGYTEQEKQDLVNLMSVL